MVLNLHHSDFEIFYFSKLKETRIKSSFLQFQCIKIHPDLNAYWSESRISQRRWILKLDLLLKIQEISIRKKYDTNPKWNRKLLVLRHWSFSSSWCCWHDKLHVPSHGLRTHDGWMSNSLQPKFIFQSQREIPLKCLKIFFFFVEIMVDK